MKNFWKDFLFRGSICAAGGPLVLAVVYGVLGVTGTMEYISSGEVCTGIVTITLLAFVAAGMTAIYQVEQLPLATMVLLHGGGLYVAYLLTYLLNGWLLNFPVPILVFTGIFLAGYGLIWLVIYLVERAKAEKLNKLLNG